MGLLASIKENKKNENEGRLTKVSSYKHKF